MSCDGPVQLEVALTIPRHERSFLKTPGLSFVEVSAVVDLLIRLVPSARGLAHLGITVRAPASVRYRREFNLGIALALLAALERLHIPNDIVFCADLNLRGALMEPASACWNSIASAQEAKCFGPGTRIVSGAEVPDFLRETDLKFLKVAELSQVVDMCGISWSMA